jgi:RHS repeat-associated protein
LGSVRGVVSSAGSLTASTSYDAWGNPETTGGLTAETPFGFAGGYTDPTGLLYLVDRYYDPASGQFLSVDPLVDETRQPYAYTGDDPVNAVDPLGLCTIKGEGQLYPGACATTGAEAIAAEQEIQAASQSHGILGDIESGVEKYDPAYSALKDYDNEYHAEQDGCSLATVFGFAAKAVVADVETGASVDGEGEVADAVDAGDEELVNLASEARTTHVLEGDATGGGHLWPGLAGKTPFPESWSGAEVMNAISDVATDPASSRVVQGGATIVNGTREGVDIQVIVNNSTDQIVSGYPTNLPRNP